MFEMIYCKIQFTQQLFILEPAEMNKLMQGSNTAGQSIVDRVMAAKHTVAGQNLQKVIGKATTEEILGPKRKHLDCMFNDKMLPLICLNVGRSLICVYESWTHSMTSVSASQKYKNYLLPFDYLLGYFDSLQVLENALNVFGATLYFELTKHLAY